MTEGNVFAKSYLMNYFSQLVPFFLVSSANVLFFQADLSQVFVLGANFILNNHLGVVKLFSAPHPDIDTVDCFLIKSENEFWG